MIFLKKAPVQTIYCEDCRWHDFGKCGHPLATNKEGPMWGLVTRHRSMDDNHYCANMRTKGWECGVTAALFEPKPAPPPPPPAPQYKGVLDNIDCTLLRIARVLEIKTKAKKP